MQITDIRIKLIDNGNDKLKAFCNVTFNNCFVIRELKIIEGPNGIFVAMPSRKITDHCGKCGSKNFILSKFCSECGIKLQRVSQFNNDGNVRLRAYADIVHPITVEMRNQIHNKVLGAYNAEKTVSRKTDFMLSIDG